MAPGASKAREFIQIQGGVGNPTAQVQATRLTDRFASVTGGEAKYLAAPGVVANKAVRDGLFEDPYIGQVAKDWNELTVALLGIGALEPSKLLKDSGNTLSDEDLSSLRAAQAVGDVCLHYFDAAGKPVESALDDRVIAISAKQLLAIPRRIGFAGGKRKVDAILAAAKGNWIDVLITDSATAEALLNAR
jgi:DNA-binding transcriptional regulator LsrR (DeoR family)